MCVCVCEISHVQFFETPRTVGLQAPMSMEFSRQEYWNGLPFPTPGDLPNLGIEPESLALAGRSFTTEPSGKPQNTIHWLEVNPGQLLGRQLCSPLDHQYCTFLSTSPKTASLRSNLAPVHRDWVFGITTCFSGGSDGKESACNVGDLGSIPGPGGSPGEGGGDPLQCSCLENPMGRGTWLAVVHSHTESNMTEQLTLSLWPVEFESKAWFPTGSTTNILGQYSLSQRLPCALQGTLQHPWPLPFRCQKHHFCPFSLDIGTLGMEVRNNTLLRIFGLINKIILKATIMQKDKCYSTDTMHVLTHSVMSEKKKKSLLQHHNLKASILWHSVFFMDQLSHPCMTTGKTTALTIWTFASKVMSLLFYMLSMTNMLVIAFLSGSKHLLISGLQSSSAVILEPKKIKSVTVSIVSPSICHEVMGPDAMI